MKGVVVVFLALLIVGCAAEEQAPQLAKPILETTGTITVEAPMDYTKERVTFTAADNTAIVANYYDAGEKSLILLHQLNLDKESWDTFARKLQRKGYTVLALDLRGHGESTGTWQSFNETQFRAMISDVKAGATFLRNKDKDVKGILGASIGANTAFKYSSEQRIPAVLLSPGLEYKGIDINTVTSTAPTIIIVGEGDPYSYGSSEELDENNLQGEHELLVVKSDKHGTYLLEEQSVTDKIEAFLGKYA